MLKIQKNNSEFIIQKGAVSIIFAILLLNMLLVIGLGISVLMLQQIRMSGQIGQTVVAFYAADAGAERCLYEVRKNLAGSCPFIDQTLDFSAQARYTTDYNGTDTITSIGRFGKASRKIELSW